MVLVIGPKDPQRNDAINTTSRSKTWSRGLSPFFLGPIETYDGLVAKNMENMWQSAKCHAQHTDENNDPTPEYFTWRDYWWAQERAERYPMGHGARPQYSWWAGEKLTYVEARKRIYVPLYAKAVVKTDAFKRLKEEYEMFGDLCLWDFDGYDHRSLDMTYADVVNCPNKKCGHSFVLAMLLENVISQDNDYAIG